LATQGWRRFAYFDAKYFIKTGKVDTLKHDDSHPTEEEGLLSRQRLFGAKSRRSPPIMYATAMAEGGFHPVRMFKRGAPQAMAAFANEQEEDAPMVMAAMANDEEGEEEMEMAEDMEFEDGVDFAEGEADVDGECIYDDPPVGFFWDGNCSVATISSLSVLSLPTTKMSF
jgi:hypothetical protein